VQDPLRQLRRSGADRDEARQAKVIVPPSDVLRVKLATGRTAVASRLLQLLNDDGRFEVLPCAEPNRAVRSGDTRPAPAVVILDCSAFAVRQRNWLQRTACSHFPARVLWYLDEKPTGNEVAQSVLDAVKLGWCHGFITGDCPSATILRAIAAVAQYDFWLPRAMLARAFSESHGPRSRSGATVAAARASDGAMALLTMRERQILHLVRRGLTNKRIGRYLGIEEDTVKKHLRNMYAKLGVHSRAQMLLRSAGEARFSR
jgi:DNA-binding NarL/FixJ family response regulator